MTDAELVEALQAIFDSDETPDGIDRSDGYGEDYRIESVRIMPGGDGFDDLEVTVRRRRGIVRRKRVARLVVDRAWREASDLNDPMSYAAYVVQRWRSSEVPAASRATRRRRPAADASVPAADICWRVLLQNLGAAYDVDEREGALEVSDGGGTVVVHVTPEEWRSFVVECETVSHADTIEDAAGPDRAPGEAFTRLEALIGSRWDDEQHIVLFRGRLHLSIRAELPPVRSMLLREPEAADDGDWYALAPDGTDGHP